MKKLSKKIIGITISQNLTSHGVVDQVIPVTWARKQHPFGRIRNRIYLQRIPNWSWNIATDFLLISKLVVIQTKRFQIWNLFFLL
jgi:hypothetical protein